MLIDLEETRKLDDQRYGSNVVASRSRRAYGPARIRMELKRKGVTLALLWAEYKTRHREGLQYQAS